MSRAARQRVLVTAAARFQLVRGDVRDASALGRVFASGEIEGVVHLAALAGVRAALGWSPRVSFEEGVGRFVNWLRARR